MPKLMQSYVHGACDVPLVGETIGARFNKTAERWSDRLALVVRHQDIRWTYAELQQRVEAFAAGLLALGLEPSDRVGIWSYNNSEWVVAQYAAAKAGLILVSLNPAYRAAELEYVLKKAGCKALITADSFKSSDYLATLRSLAPEMAHSTPGRLKAKRLPALTTLIHIGESEERGFFRFVDLLSIGRHSDRARLVELDSRAQFDDPAAIIFTSGTTGFPKGATLPHHGLLNAAFFAGIALGISANDRVCVPVPLFHIFGMAVGNLLSMVHGAAAVYPSEGFEPKTVLETVAAERCTALHGVPTMFIAELNHPDFSQYDLTSLRTGVIGGAPCPAEVMMRVAEEMHIAELSVMYGMTETIGTQTVRSDPLERRVNTVGRVTPHMEVKIVDADGRIVPPGVPGELCTRGYSVMLGYWDDDERTAEAIDRSGWLHSGDLATLNEEGYCQIVGRIKEMIIRGGEKIAPREIEEFLSAHPKVADAQIFGVPDDKFGEELCAWIKLKPSENVTLEEICDFCVGKFAHYKVPRYIRFVEEFPMTASGKPQKFRMRDEMIKELSLRRQGTREQQRNPSGS